MTKEVVINISGLQMDAETNDPVELTTIGSYYQKNGKHYVLYNEIEGEDNIVKNVLKISPDTVELTKKGDIGTHMMFENGKENLSYYDTPFGSMLLGINTKNINIEEQEHTMKLHVDYDLSINSDYISNYAIDVRIASANTGGDHR